MLEENSLMDKHLSSGLIPRLYHSFSESPWGSHLTFLSLKFVTIQLVYIVSQPYFNFKRRIKKHLRRGGVSGLNDMVSRFCFYA